MIGELRPIAKLFPMDEGKQYVFRHKRKGEFVAKFICWENGDPHDSAFARVMIPTGRGSGQERLANAVVREGRTKKTPDFSEKLLRFSLIESVEPVIEG